jgi:phosphoglycerate dehydrogenase-like enzyme
VPFAVVDFQDRRPIWTLPESAADALRAGAPAGWRLRFVDAPTDGSGDGGAAASPEALDAVRGAHVYLGAGVPIEVIRAGSDLRWVHSGSAGVSPAVIEALRGRDVVLTNSAGTHGPPVAETVIAMMLHFARGLDVAVRGQAVGRWDRDPFDAAPGPVREVAGSTVGIVGYGGIGAEVGRRAAALGALVLGLRRRQADADGVAEVLTGAEGLRRILRESDYVVLCAPETDDTRFLIDGAALAQMRPSAVLINVARGRLVDEAALAEALLAGRLRGAASDVFAVEPLSPDHPLWNAANMLITPHVSAITPRYWDREVALILDNFGRWESGAPLRNVVDTDAGY